PVQAGRLRTDTDLRPLFAKIAPRLRAYAEAVAERVAGSGDIPPPPTEIDDEARPFSRRLGRWVAQHPTLVVAFALALFGLVTAAPLLGRGQLRRGDLAPWPTEARAFLRSYASGWGDGGMGSGDAPSPAQALLGLVDIVVLGNDWLAQHALLLGTLPIAWLVALRAAALVSDRRGARLAAATAYILSPPAIAALTTGRIGALVAVPLLPAIALAGARMVRPGSAAATAWRASAGCAVLAAVLVAFEPAAAPVVLLAAAVTLMALLLVPSSAAITNAAIARVLTATVLTFILLLPWSAGLVGPRSPVVTGIVASGAVADEFTRWLLQSPTLPGFPTALVGAGLLAAGLLGLVLGFPRRPALVGAAWSIVLLSVLTAWALGRAGAQAPAWPGAPLLLASMCLAGLLAVAVAAAAQSLREHELGWRHVAVVVSGVAIVASGGAAAVHLAAEPWDAFTRDGGALPAFIVEDPRPGGPYRVLVLGDDAGVMRWDVTGPEGPTMLTFGTTAPDPLVALLGRAVEDIAAGSDPAAAARLGLANVLYVYVPEGGRSPALEHVLGDQFDLEPLPLEQGLLYRVQRWLPRAAFVPQGVADALTRRPELPMDADVMALEHVADDVYEGTVPGAGAVLVAEAEGDGWIVEADGGEIEPASSHGLMQFTVDGDVTELTVTFGRQSRRTLAVAVQSVAAVLALSLVLRPPRFAEERP
ncbi:MAG: hypothetical protein LC708_02300, partial [Actinobacteria bacterium]|nr:hypothetical protein [Actinomycetota bacterium]